MKSFNYHIFPLVCLLISGVPSCKKFVEVPPSNTQIASSAVYQDASTATAVMTNIYSKMRFESCYMEIAGSLLSDEFKSYSTTQQLVQYYTNGMTAGNTVFGCWNTAYPYIYQANSVLEGLVNNTAITASARNQLQGEAKFLRAFWHFNLANEYGDVPLVTTTDYEVNGTIARTPRSVVYQQVITDLKDAEELLNTQFVDATDTAATTERVRPTKWAAAALLARAYLYTGAYDSAEQEATKVIGRTGTFTLCSDLNQVFLMNSTEAIWQIQTPQPVSDGSTLEGEVFILLGPPSPYRNNSTTISSQLLGSFEPGDQRKTDWISSFTDNTSVPSQTYYFPYKYKVQSSPDVTEYVMVLRLAEQYLIRAEARAQKNNLSGAIEDLNVIRNRAGLVNTTASSQADLLTAIMHERQTELFVEWGHRWFDLIRTGQVDSVMSLVTPQKGGHWISGTDKLFPIPQIELSNDPKLTQNPGY